MSAFVFCHNTSFSTCCVHTKTELEIFSLFLAVRRSAGLFAWLSLSPLGAGVVRVRDGRSAVHWCAGSGAALVYAQDAHTFVSIQS